MFGTVGMNCFGYQGIADVDSATHLTARIVRSFLADTSDWMSIGHSPSQDQWLAQYGGIYFTSQTATGQKINLSKVTFGTATLNNGGATGTVFYGEFTRGTDTFLENGGTFTCGPFTKPLGHYYALRCKFSPQILSVGPLLTAAAASIVQSGATITINGVGFGQQQCSACQVSIYPNLPLKVSSWSDQAITAVMPSFNPGVLGLSVAHCRRVGLHHLHVCARAHHFVLTFTTPIRLHRGRCITATADHRDKQQRWEEPSPGRQHRAHRGWCLDRRRLQSRSIRQG